ncbi:hypothetical protein GSI_10952 [Ganoderma sinense ZZ0214-1]|uniref:Uncharacterized protein n=1 Tax=Ganoderma sinense ZZ0214-1 TaxID=1077348 RepID=A0A2G8S1Z7_9APHY|nr:hypothetical protein GSI_10952 [Ganoderma sinense ZZ0214-1]
MMPFTNVVKSKRNRGAPPAVPTPALMPAPANSKPKSKPTASQPARQPLPPLPPANATAYPLPQAITTRISPPLLLKRHPPVEHRSSASRSHGTQRNNAGTDDHDPEAAPPPQRPEGSDWQDLVDILYGRTHNSHAFEKAWDWIYESTRSLVRQFALHVNVERALTNGIVWSDIDLDERPIAHASEYDDNVEDQGVFNLILVAFPRLEENLQPLRECPSLIMTFADFITKINAKVRSDDLVRVNRHIVEALNLDAKTNQKHRRGFKHTDTARLLCPMDRLGEYDQNPDVFCQGVIDADPDDDTYQLLAVDWPVAIYKESSYDPTNNILGLLQSQCCLKVFQIIYLGPAGAIPGYRQGNKGQQSIAKKYSIKKATIESIVRSAAIARFALSSTKEWADRDGDFDSPTFVRTLLDVAFLNPTFMYQLIDWYTTHTFGHGKSESAMRRRIEKSAYGRFKSQKQELDCIPGAWYRCHLAVREANSDEEQDQSPPPMNMPNDDELEYADDPAAKFSQEVSDGERKRTRGDDDDGSSCDDDDGENSGTSHVAHKRRRIEMEEVDNEHN